MNRGISRPWKARTLAGLSAVALSAIGTLAVATPAQALGDQIIGDGPFVIGVQYEHGGFGGARFQLVSTSQGCTVGIDDVDFQTTGMGAAWNDKVSSFKTFGGGGPAPFNTVCIVNHFDNTNFGGQSTGYSFTRDYIGDAMNDRTSSIQWS